MLTCLLLCAIGVPALAASGHANQASTPSGTPPPAPANDPLAQQLQQALVEQAQLQATKQSLAGEVQAARDQRNNLVSLIEANRRSITATLNGLAAQEQAYRDASDRAAKARAQLADAQRREAVDRQLLGQYLRTRYLAQDDFITYLFSSESFADLMSRFDALSHLSEQGTSLLAEIRHQEKVADMASQVAQISADQARAAAAALAQQKLDLDGLISREQDLISRLDSDAQAAAREIGDADTQGAALAQRIADLRIAQLDQTILAAEQAAWDEATYYVQHHLQGLPSALPQQPPGTYRLDWPAPGTSVAQWFGPSPYPFEPAMFGIAHFHTGIDLSGPMGTPIDAAGPGVVVAATQSTIGYGNYIVIAHDAHTLTLYGHLQSLGVKVGDTVAQGQPIGLMGSTGNSTGPHLHFELRLDNVPSDPAPFLPPLPKGASGPPARQTP